MVTPRRQSFGRYETAQLLGRGNYAAVYEAHDPALDATVAIKVLADHHSTDPDIRERFIREARLLRRIGTDRLVAVHDIGESEGQPFIVMSCANGGTLRDRLDAAPDGPASTADLRRIVEELQACLTAVHDAGVVHRDIKPSNVLIESQASGTSAPSSLLGAHERLVLADFGLARELSQSGITVGGGTDGYMAPEQRQPGQAVDERADIYAASAVVAEVAGGKALATAAENSQVLADPLRAALMQGLAPDPRQRPQNAAAWGTSLLNALASDTDDAAPTVHRTRRSRPGVLVGSIVLAALLVVGLVTLLTTGNNTDGPDVLGPSEMTVGQTITLRADEEPDARYHWTDWQGVRHNGPVLEITARSAGTLPVTLTRIVDGQETRTEVSIRVVP